MIFLSTRAYTELVERAARAEGVSEILDVQVQALRFEKEQLTNAILSMQKEGLIVQPGHNDPAWEPYVAGPTGDEEFDSGRLVDEPDDGAADEDPELERMMVAALARAQGGGR